VGPRAAGAAPGDWIAHGAVLHAELDSLQAAWAGHDVTRAIVSNVAGAAMRERLAAHGCCRSRSRNGSAPRPSWPGLRNRYRNPDPAGRRPLRRRAGRTQPWRRQGAGGRHLRHRDHGRCGVREGEFVGGMILPGLGLMLESLARGTAQLPEPAREAALPPVSPTIRWTRSAPAACRPRPAPSSAPVAALPAELCIVSGGAAGHVAPALSVPYRMLDNIVLVGLHAAAIAPTSP
jgi:type III pantothenate kinase